MTRLFADDCLIYRTIRTPEDQLILQRDLLRVHPWTSSRTIYRDLLSVYVQIGMISQLLRAFVNYQAEAEVISVNIPLHHNM